jgi:hypothetical protein
MNPTHRGSEALRTGNATGGARHARDESRGVAITRAAAESAARDRRVSRSVGPARRGPSGRAAPVAAAPPRLRVEGTSECRSTR